MGSCVPEDMMDFSMQILQSHESSFLSDIMDVDGREFVERAESDHVKVRSSKMSLRARKLATLMPGRCTVAEM